MRKTAQIVLTCCLLFLFPSWGSKVLAQESAKAGETGKLYGSVTTQDVANAIMEQTKYEVKRQQIDMQPIREIGEFKAHVRLTIDLVPEIKIIVHREGEVAGAEAEEEPAAEEKPKKPRGRKKAEETQPAKESKSEE